MESAFGVEHGFAKGLNPKNMNAIHDAARGTGIGNAPQAMRRSEYAFFKDEVRNAGKKAKRGPGSSVEHSKGQLKYLASNPSAPRGRKSGGGPRWKLP